MVQNASTKRGRGERVELVLLVGSLLIPLILFALVAYKDWQNLLSNAEFEVAEGSDGIRGYALKFFQTDELALEAVDQRIRSMNWDEIAGSSSVHDYLKKLTQRFPQIGAVSLIDAHGVVRNSSTFFPVPGNPTISARDFFTAARGGDNGLLVSRAMGPAAYFPEAHFDVAKRRNGEKGGFDGVIVLSISPANFRSLWSREPPGTLTDLARRDLNILVREPPAVAEEIQPKGAVAEAVAAGRSGTFRTASSVDGIERIFAYRFVDPYDAIVVRGISLGVLRARWWADLRLYGAFFGAAALSLAGMAFAVLQRSRRARLATERLNGALSDLGSEKELRKIVETQLHHAEKLEALGQAAGGLAHDLNNLLSSILLNLGLLGSVADEKRSRILGDAIADTERAAKAVRSALAFARRHEFDLREVKLKLLLSDIESLLESAVGPGTALQFDIGDATWPIKADSDQLELALLNLAINARDAMPDGGIFRIAARNVHLEGEPHGLTGDFVALSASDTGIGMPADVAAHSSEPFFTTKDPGKGSGLGLTQVRGFAVACGGAIAIASEVGRGTIVTLYLRRYAPAENPMALSMSRPG